ncbi:MAG: tRNA adenosine(34) deaminase TadA [Pseudomonadota bacterium]
MQDEDWMQLALEQARQAQANGEVPVGAIIVHKGEVIATGGNAPIGDIDPTAHAEMNALHAAAWRLGNYRLSDCEMYVTLEPCAMCAGAMLHARLKRVVFGAPDPKTGAAGSVLNLFGTNYPNHQTELVGGVLAQDCGALLQDFFRGKRAEQRETRRANHPLREDAVRTPNEAFAGLPGYPWAPHFLSELPSLSGLRMHYLDEGPPDTGLTYLCLHGNPAWSYLYRKMIPVFLAAGHRVVAPDLIGFGKSDKPKKESAHSFTWHRNVLLEFIEELDLRNVVLVVQDWGGLLGLTLPMASPERYRGLLVMNTLLATGDVQLPPGFLAWREMCAKNPEFDVARLFARGNPHMTPQECAAYMAPFPDKGHRAATRAFPALVPETPDADGAEISREARDFWQYRWHGQTLMAVGAQDPVLGPPVMQALRNTISSYVASGDRPMLVEQGGHFVQEHGVPIAERAVRFFQ